MAALDKIHNAVKNALIKDGWMITDEPYKITVGNYKLLVDLAAEKLFAAEKDGKKIAVEAKSFLSSSRFQDLYGALGQYNTYETYLEIQEPDRKLYLAINDKVYKEFFEDEVIQILVDKFQISFVLVNLDEEKITQWKSWLVTEKS